MISNELQNLLAWGVPKMTEEGSQLFSCKMEIAIREVVEQAFEKYEMDAFHVKSMLRNSA